MAKKIRVWDGTAWQDVAPSLPYTAIHSAQASMPATGVDGQVWLDTDGTLAGQDFVPLSGGTMTGNLNTPSINGGGIAGFNNVINGGFDFWQRGTSFSLTTTAYIADRFNLASTSSSSASRSTDVPANNYSRYSLSATSDQWANGIYTLIENGANLVNGRTYTFSAWVKGPSGKTANISIGWHGESASYTFTGNWQYISRTTTFSESFRSTNGGGDTLYLHFVRNVAGGASQLVSGNTVLITQCKMEEGSQATPFVKAGITLDGELAACQRYYQRWAWGSPSDHLGNGQGSGGQQARRVNWATNTTMRIPPSLSYSGTITMYDGNMNARNLTSLGYTAGTTTNRISADFNTNQGNLNLGDYIFVLLTNGSYFEASAEL
jgi:hypothetical protein